VGSSPAAPTFCVAVDTSGYATIYNGSTWSSPSHIDGSRSINAVTCTSSTFCMAVGASGYAIKYTGSWGSASHIDSSRSLSAVSCTSSSFCMAADSSGYAVTYTGSWGSASDIDGSRSISAVSCPSTTFCVAVDASGYAAKYTGSWATAADVDSSRAIKALACPSSTLCVAVDASGYALTYNGSAWATPVDADASRALDTLSYASTTFCVAADTTGYTTAYNGTAWSTPTDIDAARSVSSVSCTSSTFCAAVDTSGYGTLYATGPSSTSQLTWDLTSTLPNILSDGTYDYLYGPDGTTVEEIALATSTPTYLSFTASDSTWVSTNEAGDLTGLWGYDAFGTLANGTPTSAFGYGGQYTDATTGFGVNRARDYNSATGSFTTRDPAFATTDTAYTYAGGDPVNGGDPSGLSWDDPSWLNKAAGATWNGIVETGECLANSNCFSPQGLANITAGFANQAVQLVDALICNGDNQQVCPTWSVGTPYPCGPQGSYQVGEALFFGLGLLVAGVDEVGVASDAVDAADSAGLDGGLVAGSGRVAGVLEASPNVKSVAAINAWNGSSAEFVFDPETNTFAMGAPAKGLGFKGSPHQQLAAAIGANPNSVVGGVVFRGPDGALQWDEMSGHYYQNWTDSIRQEFVNTMRGYGVKIDG